MQKPKNLMVEKIKQWDNYYGEPKIDGIRGYYYQGRLLSYNHKPIYNAQPILDALYRIPLLAHQVIDGELYSINGGWEATLSILKSSKTKKDLGDIQFYAFDLTDHPNHPNSRAFSKGGAPIPFIARQQYLTELLRKIKKPVVQVQSVRLRGYQHFRLMYEHCLKIGYEGIMIKNLMSPYSWMKRTGDWLRLKPTTTEDVTIIGMKQGTGKYRHTLGALSCIDKNGLPISVSGMSDDERDDFWEFNKAYTGKIIEISFLKRTKSNHIYSAQFIRMREDKEA